jgi:hypothetical protein
MISPFAATHAGRSGRRPDADDLGHLIRIAPPSNVKKTSDSLPKNDSASLTLTFAPPLHETEKFVLVNWLGVDGSHPSLFNDVVERTTG